MKGTFYHILLLEVNCFKCHFINLEIKKKYNKLCFGVSRNIYFSQNEGF